MLTNPDPHTPPGVSFPPGPQCITVAGGGALSSGVGLASRIFQPQKVNFHPYFQKDLLFSLFAVDHFLPPATRHPYTHPSVQAARGADR